MQHNKAILLMLTSLLCAHNTTHSYVPTNDNGLFFAAGVMTAGAIGVVVAGYAHSHLRKDHNVLDAKVSDKDDGVIAQLEAMKKRLAELEADNKPEARRQRDEALVAQATRHVVSINEESTRRIERLQRDSSTTIADVQTLKTLPQLTKEDLEKIKHLDTANIASKALVDALATRIGSLDDRFTTLDVQVGRLNTTNTDAVKKAQAEWETLKRDFSTARTQVDQYLKNAANINTQVTNLTDNYQATNATVNGLKKQLQDDHANAAQQALKQIKDLEKRFDALEKHKAESAAVSSPATTASAAAIPLSPAPLLPESTATAAGTVTAHA